MRRGHKLHYKKYRHQARLLVHERLHYFAKRYGVSYRRVTIRNQKTRWGSCTKEGSLSFNYRLLFLPPEIRDYIVVHEVCHLREFNHSPSFWNLVAETVPHHKILRGQLRAIEKSAQK